MARSETHRRVSRSTVSAFIALVAGVVAIMALVGVALLSPIQEVSRIGDEHARAVSVASRLRGRLSELRREVMDCVLDRGCPQTPGSAERYRRLADVASELDAFADTATERDTLTELRATLDASGDAAEAIEAAIRGGDPATARQVVAAFLADTGAANAASERIVNFNARQVRESVARVRRGVILAFGAGSVLAALVIVAGVVLLRHARASMERYAGALERHSEEMGAFAARAAHEIRTPLQTLTLALAALDERGTERRALSAARSSARRLAATVDAILEFSRSGAAPSQGACADVSAVVGEVLSELGGAAADAGVALVDEVPPGAIASIAPEHLRVVLTNLVANAIRYGADSTAPRVTVGARAIDDGIALSVTDTGPGIAPEALAHLFEPFVRGSDKPGGFGLGLATVHQIVTAYSGRVRVDRVREGGTLFVVELPRPSAATVARTVAGA